MRREYVCPRCGGPVSDHTVLLCKKCRHDLRQHKVFPWKRPIDAIKGLEFSETIVVSNWPKPLIRKKGGCDFEEKDTGNLVEVKTRSLSDDQLDEMRAAFTKHRFSYLVVVGPSPNGSRRYSYIFRLEQVRRIPKLGRSLEDRQRMTNEKPLTEVFWNG